MRLALIYDCYVQTGWRRPGSAAEHDAHCRCGKQQALLPWQMPSLPRILDLVFCPELALDLLESRNERPLSAATTWCAANTSCNGFTAQVGSSGNACGASGVFKVYFKAGSGLHPNIDKQWVSYGKATKPCVRPCSSLSLSSSALWLDLVTLMLLEKRFHTFAVIYIYIHIHIYI